MDFEQLCTVINTNLGTLIFAVLGSVFLTDISIKEHLGRYSKDKMPKPQYIMYCLTWVIGYPVLGFVVASAYLATDNNFGAWMALQIGLSSPAIIVGLASGGANFLAKDGIQTQEGQ